MLRCEGHISAPVQPRLRTAHFTLNGEVAPLRGNSSARLGADETTAPALSKTGLRKIGTHGVTGEVYLAQIGIPDEANFPIHHEPGFIFARRDILTIG